MLCPLSDYRRYTGDTCTVDGDVADALNDAQQQVEEYCQRKFEQAERTEVMLVHTNGYAYPDAFPIVSASIGFVDGNGIALGYGNGVTWPVNINWLTSWPIPRVSITYTGGYAPEDMPVSLKRRVAAIANASLSPSPLPAGISGATSISIGDLAIGGSRGLVGFVSLSTDDKAELNRWRKREILPQPQTATYEVAPWPFR